MMLLAIYLLGIFLAVGGAIWALLSDIKSLRIPNEVSILAIAGFILAFTAAYSAEGVFSGLLSHMLAAILIFIITLLLYVTGIFGAGDAKMASAYSLWFGLEGLPLFLIVMALTGGLLGALSLLLRKVALPQKFQLGWIKKLKNGENAVPYGVAIAAGIAAVFDDREFVSFNTLSIILNQ